MGTGQRKVRTMLRPSRS